MVEIDFTETSFWDVRPDYLPTVEDIYDEYPDGIIFIISAVGGVVTHQSPERVAKKMLENHIIDSVPEQSWPTAA